MTCMSANMTNKHVQQVAQVICFQFTFNVTVYSFPKSMDKILMEWIINGTDFHISGLQKISNKFNNDK